MRLGFSDAARELVLRGLRLNPDHPGLLARAVELAEGLDPWPSAQGGFDGACASFQAGPDAGVLRWRIQLPYEPVGCPLVHSDGSIFVSMFPSGIVRVTPDGAISVHSDWWPSDVPPVLSSGLPVAFDPGLDEVSGAGVDGDAPQELWPAALGEEGWSYALSPTHVLGVGPELGQRWVSPCTAPRALTVAKGGALAVIAQRNLNVLAAETGESSFQGALEFVDRAVFAPHGALVLSGWEGIDPAVVCHEVDGSVRWQRRRDTSAFAVNERVVVATSTTDGVNAFDLGSGELCWEQRELRTGGGVALDARGYAYVLGPGWVAGIRPDGSLLFRLSLPTRGSRNGVALGSDATAYVTSGRALVAIR